MAVWHRKKNRCFVIDATENAELADCHQSGLWPPGEAGRRLLSRPRHESTGINGNRDWVARTVRTISPRQCGIAKLVDGFFESGAAVVFVVDRPGQRDAARAEILLPLAHRDLVLDGPEPLIDGF